VGSGIKDCNQEKEETRLFSEGLGRQTQVWKDLKSGVKQSGGGKITNSEGRK